MNILFVTPVFLERNIEGSGMPIAIYRMAKALKQAGDNPMIVTGGNRDKYEIFYDIPVWRVNTDKVSCCSNKIINIVKECAIRNYILQQKVNDICKKNEIDIIQYAGNNGTGMFHNLDIPAVMRVSSYYKLVFSDYTTLTKGEVNLHSLFERLAMKRMNHIYCPSLLLADYLGKEINRKCKVIETIFYIEDIQEDISVYERKLEGKSYILYYGALIPRKGVLLIADIADRVLNKYQECNIVVIGHDVDVAGKSVIKMMREKIGSRYKDRFIFLPSLSHEKLYPVIKGAEFVMLPSYMENVSNACMEAMALGKIVIGSKGASFEQLIVDEENGFLMERGNSEDLYRCVCKALELSNDDKRKMGEKAKKRVDMLKPEASVPKLQKYYKAIINAYRAKQH